MAFRNGGYRGWLLSLAASACLVSWATAQDYRSPAPGSQMPLSGYQDPGRPLGQPAQRPPIMLAQAPHQEAEQTMPGASQPVALGGGLQPNEHPLMPAIRWARDGLHNIQQIEDYSAVLVKREQVNGKLGDEQYLFLKVRHRPMSVYMYFLKPEGLQGQELIWIEDQNDGKMWAHGTGLKSVFGTVSLNPTGGLAMEGQRYPVTEVGILNLVERLLERAQEDTQFGECEVKFFPGAKINNRTCTCIRVMHPVPRRNFLCHMAIIFVDDELNVPIRYESYDWPGRPGESPPLIEQYTYLNLKLNNGFTDADFDIRNPQYG
ncbi:MAG: hypothetical protein A2V98_10240, partial [Planctomycetes bacterium RBG_16_64_12]